MLGAAMAIPPPEDMGADIAEPLLIDEPEDIDDPGAIAPVDELDVPDWIVAPSAVVAGGVPVLSIPEVLPMLELGVAGAALCDDG